MANVLSSNNKRIMTFLSTPFSATKGCSSSRKQEWRNIYQTSRWSTRHLHFLCKDELSFVPLHSKAEHFLGTKNTPARDIFLETHASISQASGHWFLKRTELMKKKKKQKYKSIALFPHHQTPAFASNRDQQIPV